MDLRPAGSQVGLRSERARLSGLRCCRRLGLAGSRVKFAGWRVVCWAL